ncbi:hypothetical protein B0T17DRAFT_612119 [Bombardia bombarda]|uniref:Uncharacterized protein n=1 Tax=Bombardia bombarda TaxID=252184 RepID=A0AA39XJS5_9PEZI|nr:hypothetical protein B0T17DRAFT_612119 [Bombardia bombarda]
MVRVALPSLASDAIITSTFLACEPIPTADPVYTTSYCVTYPAACPTSAWTATYTVVTECTGDPALFTPPPTPPNFVVTTVTCPVCDEPTQTITCPNALGTAPVVINGNGITATVTLTSTAGGDPGHGAWAPGGAPAGPTGAASAGGYVTAGASPSIDLKKALLLVFGLTFAAGNLLL